MCTSPIRIRNPNKGQNKEIFWYKDTTSEYINIPCGCCPDCIALEQIQLVQRIQMEAVHNYLFMGTLTYDNDHLPKTDINGYNYKYVDIKNLTNTFKRLRQKNTYGIPFRYIYTTERGSKYGRPHIHILQLFKKEDIGNYTDVLDFETKHAWDLFHEWRINKGSDTRPIYENLSQYRESIRGGVIHKTYDWHYVNPYFYKGIRTENGVTDVAFYVLKYMMKQLDQRKTKQAILRNSDDITKGNEAWKMIKNRQLHSLGFGWNIWNKEGRKLGKPDEQIIQYLREGVERSKKTSKYALYYCPDNLLTFPLAKYYKNNGEVYTLDDVKIFWEKNEHKLGDNSDPIEHKSITSIIKSFNDYERKLKFQELSVFDDVAEELYY